MKWIIKPSKQATTITGCVIFINICGARFNV